MKCRSCRLDALPGKTRCQKHNDIHRADCARRAEARKTSGLCPQCGATPADGLKLCRPCLEASKAHVKAKRAAGGCIRCSMNTRAVAAGMCLPCWFRKMASDCCGLRGAESRRFAIELAALWHQQNGRCAVTGSELVPGSNASLDHIFPKSRGGTNSIDNLRWIDFAVNRAKSDLTEDEFHELCRRVVRFASRKARGRREQLAEQLTILL